MSIGWTACFATALLSMALGGAPSQAASETMTAANAQTSATAASPRPTVRDGLAVPKGSRVALPLVEGFIETAGAIGLANESADSLITIADLPSVPPAEIETVVSRTLRLQSGVRIEKTETITRTDGTASPLVKARRVAGGHIYTLMGIGIALPETLAVVTIAVRRDGPISESAARDLLLQVQPALESEVTTPDHLLDFTVHPPPPLRYVTIVEPSAALYTIGPVKRPTPSAQPLLVIGFSRQPPPPETVSAADLARVAIQQIASIDKVEVRNVVSTRLAGYPASEAIADAVDRADGTPRRVIQWLASAPGGQLIVFGLAQPQEADAAFAAFRAGVATLVVKPERP